jgi:hypothetical protein
MPPSSTRASAEEDAPLQSGWGGLAGSTVHPLALGNVARLAQLLRSRTETDDERLRGIVLIGVGGAGDAEAVERFRRAGADAVVSLFFFPLCLSFFASFPLSGRPDFSTPCTHCLDSRLKDGGLRFDR